MAKVIFDGAGEMPELNRITAKKNYASSSQAHKMGATAMFNDILHYLGKEKYPKLINEVKGQVAVRQHPVYAFQKIPIEGSEGQYNRKFIGLFTVGPDKGDKNYFGFTNSRIKDRAIRLEGTDHLKGVGFNYPWTVNGVDKIKYNHAEESLCIITGSDKTKWTKIWEQSVCGDKETEAEIEEYLKEVYKPAYEVAYYNNPLIVGVDMTLSEINSNIEAFGKRRRVKDDRQYSYCEFWIDGEYDIYYLDTQTNKYEKNGINLLSDLGITADEIAGMTIEEKNDLFISRRVARFKEEAKYYFCIDDAVYQLMFLFIIVASDNFEKNMYPYIMELLWRFFQDDLDSIFSTDNQAQNTKKYSAELHDFTDDTKSAYVFKGEDSAFWQLIELAYGDECKQMGRDIFQAMYDLAPRGTTTMEKLMAFFDEYFFNRAQKYFTPSAYNNDTEYSYEEAWNNKEYVASVDIHPLAQALGSQESTERAFLEKRLIYLMSKFSFGGFGSATDTDLGIISVRTQDPQSFTLTPAIDLYPTVLGGQAQSAVATERVMAGQSVTLPAVGGGNTNVYIVGADWLSDIGDLKDLKVDPSSVVTLTISSKRLRRIKVGDENADSVTSYLGSLSIQKCDSLETIDARNLQTLVGTVDLSNCPRLVEALFGGSNANAIIIAPGSKVEKLQFSDSITTIDLRNNTFLKDVEITSFAKIRFLRLENVPIINGFDVLRQAYNTAGQQLENIRIIGFTYTGNADDLFMLSNIVEGKDKDGNAHKYGSIDANGDPDENSLPVIEGSLHITETVNRSTYDFVQEAFHALALTADNIVDYFIFADPEVSRIVAQNWGDGTGTTVEQIEAITDIGSVFKGNTLIKNFDEFSKFTGVQFVSTEAFQDDTFLETIKLPNVTKINHRAFKNTSNLYIELPNTIEFIGEEAFVNSKGGTHINLPKLSSLEARSFYKSGFLSIENLGLITKIPNSAYNQGTFAYMSDLIMVNIPESVVIIGNGAFTNDAKLTNCNIPKNIVIIGDSAFSGCTSLIVENLSYQKLTYIGGYAFLNVVGIVNEVNLPSLEELPTYALKGLKVERITNLGKITFAHQGNGYRETYGIPSVLKSIVFPSTLIEVSNYVLTGYKLLEYIVFNSITPPALGGINAFNDTNNCPIYVPDASVEAYKTATNWNAYASRIQSIFYYLGYIDFVDPAVRDICVANFDTDGDGVVSIEEAAAVTDIGTIFQGNTQVQTFNEFKYFTGITTTSNASKWGSMKEITLPRSITSIPQLTLGYSQLEKITLECECDFRSNATRGSRLKEFAVNPTNQKYKAINGSLYSKDGTILYAVPQFASVVDLSSVTTLKSNALDNFEGLSELTIPSTLTTLESSAMQGIKVNKMIIEGDRNGTTGISVANKGIFIFKGKLTLYSNSFQWHSPSAIIFESTEFQPLPNASAFNNSSIAGGTGFIYVQDDLVDTYKSAENWSTYASQIKPLSEYVES